MAAINQASECNDVLAFNIPMGVASAGLYLIDTFDLTFTGSSDVSLRNGGGNGIASIELVDAWFSTDQAGTARVLTLKNGSDTIGTISGSATANALARLTTLDDTYSTITVDQTLRVAAAGTDIQGRLFVAYKVNP